MRMSQVLQRADVLRVTGALRQSQRDCGLQPKVARKELPWATVLKTINPNGVVANVAVKMGLAATALRLGMIVGRRPRL